MFDHYAVEYSFADGTRLLAQGRHMLNCLDLWGNVIPGSMGSAVLGVGVSEPRLYRGWKQAREHVVWHAKGKPAVAYQREHDLLFDAIRQDKPYNETQRCAMAAMTGILGRMAAEGGQEVLWDEVFRSPLELAPGLESITSLDQPAPVLPDAQGRYPIAMPGVTKVL